MKKQWKGTVEFKIAFSGISTETVRFAQFPKLKPKPNGSIFLNGHPVHMDKNLWELRIPTSNVYNQTGGGGGINLLIYEYCRLSIILIGRLTSIVRVRDNPTADR